MVAGYKGSREATEEKTRLWMELPEESGKRKDLLMDLG